MRSKENSQVREELIDINEIKTNFGDCDWMRAVLNGYTVDAILWMINKIETLEKKCMLPNPCGDDTPGECDSDCIYHINEDDPDED